jgi:hypothetical protein
MLKRTIPLFVAVAVVLSVTIPAQAGHCVRCRVSGDLQWCQYGLSHGRADCIDDFGICLESNEPCNGLYAAVTPLSAEYQVASVERIDQAPAPDEALVAKLDASQPAAESGR